MDFSDLHYIRTDPINWYYYHAQFMDDMTEAQREKSLTQSHSQ